MGRAGPRARWSPCSSLPETPLVLKVKKPVSQEPNQSFQPVLAAWLKDVTTSQSHQEIKEIMSVKMFWEFLTASNWKYHSVLSVIGLRFCADWQGGAGPASDFECLAQLSPGSRDPFRSWLTEWQVRMRDGEMGGDRLWSLGHMSNPLCVKSSAKCSLCLCWEPRAY